jgi:hypothetical protein
MILIVCGLNNKEPTLWQQTQPYDTVITKASIGYNSEPVPTLSHPHSPSPEDPF